MLHSMAPEVARLGFTGYPCVGEILSDSSTTQRALRTSGAVGVRGLLLRLTYRSNDLPVTCIEAIDGYTPARGREDWAKTLTEQPRHESRKVDGACKGFMAKTLCLDPTKRLSAQELLDVCATIDHHDMY